MESQEVWAFVIKTNIIIIIIIIPFIMISLVRGYKTLRHTAANHTNSEHHTYSPWESLSVHSESGEKWTEQLHVLLLHVWGLTFETLLSIWRQSPWLELVMEELDDGESEAFVVCHGGRGAASLCSLRERHPATKTLFPIRTGTL